LDYQESGVIQVWIDPAQNLVELIHPDRPLQFFRMSQALVISPLADFRLELEKLFRV
jgi:hypothetical protein